MTTGGQGHAAVCFALVLSPAVSGFSGLLSDGVQFESLPSSTDIY